MAVKWSLRVVSWLRKVMLPDAHRRSDGGVEVERMVIPWADATSESASIDGPCDLRAVMPLVSAILRRSFRSVCTAEVVETPQLRMRGVAELVMRHVGSVQVTWGEVSPATWRHRFTESIPWVAASTALSDRRRPSEGPVRLRVEVVRSVTGWSRARHQLHERGGGEDTPANAWLTLVQVSRWRAR